jgi:hypothetical protein
MALLAMVVSALQGTGFWTPVMLIGATYLGVDWIEVPFWSTLLGVLTHLFFGAGFGVFFAALTRNVATFGAKMAAGLVYGAVVYLFMTFLVMPWADPVMYVSIDKGAFFVLHLLFGAALPLALHAQQRPAHLPWRKRREA